MSQSDKSGSQAVPSYYDAHYGNFQTELYSDIRRESSGEDIGQNSWLTAGEQHKFLSWLGLAAGKTLLDVACGVGGPALRIAALTVCALTGVDVPVAGSSAAQSGDQGSIARHSLGTLLPPSVRTIVACLARGVVFADDFRGHRTCSPSLSRHS